MSHQVHPLGFSNTDKPLSIKSDQTMTPNIDNCLFSYKYLERIVTNVL